MWNLGTLGFRLQFRDQFVLSVAGLLGNQIANFFRNFDDGDDLLVVALLLPLDDLATLTAQLDWQLLALRVSDKLSGLLLVVPRRAGRLEVGLALLLSTP